MGVKWCLIMVVMCISVMHGNVEHHFMCLSAIVYLLCGNVHSKVPGPIFNQVVYVFVVRL